MDLAKNISLNFKYLTYLKLLNVDLPIAWNRWHTRAIKESAQQLHGAEKWLREQPSRVFMDAKCESAFPLAIGPTNLLRFHLVAVTKNSAIPAQRYFNGQSSGSLMLVPHLADSDVSKLPFVINDIDPRKTFVHVLDELTLSLLLEELDTTADFVKYLSAKEAFIRSGILQSSPGEEELLAHYILSGGLIVDDPLRLPLRIPKDIEQIALSEGLWNDYASSPQRMKMREANKVSYFWDKLIENFAEHIAAGTVALEQDQPTANHERVVRLLAKENRFGRRILAEQFIEKLRTTPAAARSSRMCPSPLNDGSVFVLVLFPREKDQDYSEYRSQRVNLLHAYAAVIQYRHPNFKMIILIGMEPQDCEGRSEDILAIECGELTEEERIHAQELISEGRILADVTSIQHHSSLAPRKQRPNGITAPALSKTKMGRNNPCTCGSGLKWKKCCMPAHRNA